MRTFSAVVNAWPSAAELARDLGISEIRTRAWRNREMIPAENWLAVVEAANRRGIEGVTLDLLAGLASQKRQSAA